MRVMVSFTAKPRGSACQTPLLRRGRPQAGRSWMQSSRAWAEFMRTNAGMRPNDCGATASTEVAVYCDLWFVSKWRETARKPPQRPRRASEGALGESWQASVKLARTATASGRRRSMGPSYVSGMRRRGNLGSRTCRAGTVRAAERFASTASGPQLTRRSLFHNPPLCCAHCRASLYWEPRAEPEKADVGAVPSP